jgi:hypothetical protein
MKIVRVPLDQALSDGPVDAFSHLVLSQSPRLSEILDCMAEQRAAFPSQRFLCTLDDLDQCCYTSMHASDDARIAFGVDAGEDATSHTEAFAARCEVLSHVIERLEWSEHRVEWSTLTGSLSCSDQDVQTLSEVNDDPDSILDDIVCIQRVPVTREDLLIAALPNGYFEADWDIFQNHALARHLRDRFSYRLFGMGASWLGFQREDLLADADVLALIGDLQTVYGSLESADAWAALGDVLRRRTTLFLGYTEDFGV